MQSTPDVSDFKRQGNISPWSLDEMDWALLQKTGMINPSLNMNLNELILGILVLMYVLNEVIIQGIKVMALGKCSKTQWLRHMGLKQHPAGAGTGTAIAPALVVCQSSRKTSAPGLSHTGLRGVSSEHRMRKCCLSPDSLQSSFSVLTHAACSSPRPQRLYAEDASALCFTCQDESFLALSAILDALLCKCH